jgi:hypothetical protein
LLYIGFYHAYIILCHTQNTYADLQTEPTLFIWLNNFRIVYFAIPRLIDISKKCILQIQQVLIRLSNMCSFIGVTVILLFLCLQCLFTGNREKNKIYTPFFVVHCYKVFLRKTQYIFNTLIILCVAFSSFLIT